MANLLPPGPGIAPVPQLKVERMFGRAVQWRWTILLGGAEVARSEVPFRGAEAAWEAGNAAMARRARAAGA